MRHTCSVDDPCSLDCYRGRISGSKLPCVILRPLVVAGDILTIIVVSLLLLYFLFKKD